MKRQPRLDETISGTDPLPTDATQADNPGSGSFETEYCAMTQKQPPWADGTVHALNEVEAFDAMVAFVTAFWERSLRPDDELGFFVDLVSRGQDGMGDPAHWSDWLEAISIVKARGENRLAMVEVDKLIMASEGFLERLRATLAATSTGKHHRLSCADETLLFQLIQLARDNPATRQA